MTAVQRLADYVRTRYETNEVFNNLVSNLIEKEKRQIIDAFDFGWLDADINGEEYYNETYNNESNNL
jgi:hypothetical protein